MGKMINAYKILVGKPEGKRQLRQWKNNIKMDVVEIGWEFVDWMHLVHDMNQWRALVNTIMNLPVA
jgi:hypothetical protein